MLDKSINLARRLSARNEPDLLQENFLDSENEENEYTLEYCENLTAKISSLNDIPQECRQYSSICEALLRRRDSNKHDYAIAFQGMSSGQALSAMAAREKGHLNPIQIQRRFTNRKASDRRVW